MQKTCLIEKENHRVLIACEPATAEERKAYDYKKDCETFVEILTDYIEKAKANACFFLSDTAMKSKTATVKKTAADILPKEIAPSEIVAEKTLESEKESTVFSVLRYSTETAKTMLLRRENIYIGDENLQNTLMDMEVKKVKMLHIAHFPVMRDILETYFQIGTALVCSTFSPEWGCICIYYKDECFAVDILKQVLPSDFEIVEM